MELSITGFVLWFMVKGEGRVTYCTGRTAVVQKQREKRTADSGH